jgi:hypothetical protein
MPSSPACSTRIVAAARSVTGPEIRYGRGASRVFATEDLADLLTVSVSSLKRYQSGEPRHPDDVAARLHFLALVVGDLAGSYNEIGVRRWFHRKRTLLDGRNGPRHFSTRLGSGRTTGPSRVRQLARSARHHVGHMIAFRQVDGRYPFLWESAAQPAGRWHGEGEGPGALFCRHP